MANNDPNQIDISLEVLGEQSMDVLNGFVERLSQLHDSLKRVQDQQAGVLRAMGQQFQGPITAGGAGGPSVSSAAERVRRAAQGIPEENPGSAPNPGTPAGSTSSGASDANTRRKLSRFEDFAGGISKRFGERGIPNTAYMDEMQIFGGSGGGSSGSGGISSGASGGDNGMPEWYNVLHPRSQVPLSIPRYGEFNVQDITGLMAQGLGKYSISNIDKARKKAQDAGEEFSLDSVKDRVRIAGAVGSMFDTVSDVSPYFKAIQQLGNNYLGMGFGSRSMVGQGQGGGLARGGGQINIPGVGGFNIPFSQYFGAAGGEAFHEDKQAIDLGRSAGLTIKQSRELQESLKGQGWYGKDLSRLTDIIARVKMDKNINAGSDETTAPIADQITRYAVNSSQALSTLKDVLREVGPAATAAHLGVDELKRQLDQVANNEQQYGATYPQGIRNGMEFTNATGLSPLILSQLRNSPMIQTQLMAQTGLPPFSQGLVGPGAVMGATYRTMNMLKGAFGNLQSIPIKDQFGGSYQITGEDRQNAAIAHHMGLSTDQVRDFMAHPRQYQARSALSEQADVWSSRAREIQDSDLSAADKRKALFALNRGEKNAPGLGHLHTLMNASGLGSKWADVMKVTDPQKRAEKIQNLLADASGEKRTDMPKVTIGLSDEAKKHFGIWSSDQKDQANRGETNINIPAGRWPIVPSGTRRVR